jgi:hypothetical protein
MPPGDGKFDSTTAGRTNKELVTHWVINHFVQLNDVWMSKPPHDGNLALQGCKLVGLLTEPPLFEQSLAEYFHGLQARVCEHVGSMNVSDTFGASGKINSKIVGYLRTYCLVSSRASRTTAPEVPRPSTRPSSY